MIREGRKEDIPAVLELIKELALFEKAEDQVETTVESMEKDGFGENPLFQFFVAEAEGNIIGLSLYYYRNSTWKGKRLYLEDLIVSKKYRGQGIGKELFEATGRVALKENCSGMAWEVLEWNEGAIEFYKKYNTEIDGEWLNCSVDATTFSKS